MTNIFLPSTRISGKTMRTVIAGQLLFIALLWFFSPFVFLPHPGETVRSLRDLWVFDSLGQELLTSFLLNLQALLFSTVLSLGLAYLSTIGFFRPPVALFGKLRFLSMAGLSFFFTLMTVNGEQMKLSMLVFGISVFFVTGMIDVIACIPAEQYDLAKTLGMNPWRTLLEVVILGQSDQAFLVMRQNAAMGLLLLSLVEGMDRSGGGVGGLLLNQNKYFHLSAVMGIQLCVLGMGLAQDWSLGWLRQACCPWVNARRTA